MTRFPLPSVTSILLAAALGAAAHAQTATTETSSPEGIAVLRWDVSNEADLRVYRILRGDNPEGPWEQIGMLNGEGAGLHGPQHYEFIERNLEVGQRLYYIIEHEDIRGNVLRAGPISYLVDRAPSDEVTQSAGATPEAAHSEAAP